MSRNASHVLATLAVVVALVAVPIGGAAQVAADAAYAQTDPATETADENATIAPGEQLMGVVGVQGAEVEGEVESRAFGIAVARAATANETADVVADRFDRVTERVQALETRQTELREARENGSMSDGEYKARMAQVAVQSKHAERMANETANASQGLPVDRLEARGVNASAIQQLQANAGELSGPETAAIATTIAGEQAGSGIPSQASEAGDRGEGERPTARPGGGDATESPAGAGMNATESPTAAGENATESPTAAGQNATEGRDNGSQAPAGR
jgi:hypothetical protein